MKSPMRINQELNNLIPIICTLSRVHTIYLIRQVENTISYESDISLNKPRKSSSRYVFTMLIISHEHVDDPKRFMNEVFSKTQGRCELYSIHYTLNQVNNKINYGSNFLSRILRECTLLYRADNRLELPNSYLHHPEVYKGIANHWKKRIAHALYFEEKSTIIEENQSIYGRYLLLQQAIQQTCLGLIYVFWEYQPSYFSLSYLLHLCDQFTDLPNIIYPKKSFRSHLIYSRLCHARYNLNEKLQEDPSESHRMKAEFWTCNKKVDN